MRVTTNVHRSASSILELFKFVTSLALVSAVSVWLGVIGSSTPTLQVPELDYTLVLAGFVLLLVRYYHGNSLHLLERYAEGSPSRRLDLALPTDAFFILAQGLVLLALSFAIRNPTFFIWLLLALLVIDVVWTGTLIRLNEEPSNSYLRVWFLINLIFAATLVVIRVSTLNSGNTIDSVILFAFILGQTLADYWWAWRRYFPAPEDQRLMIGAPFTAKVVDGQWSDKEMMQCIMRVYYLCQQNDYEVYSAHFIEEFGTKLRKIDKYVIEDVREAKDAAIYVGITDGTISNGMAVELGIAAAFGTQILLFVQEQASNSSFLEELVRTHSGVVLRYSTSDDLVEQLCKKLKLKKGQDPGGLIRSLTTPKASNLD